MANEKKEPVTIGKIKEERQKGPLVVLIIMILLIAVVIFLPNIKSFVETKIGKNNNPDVFVSPKKDNPPIEDKKIEESKTYTLTSDLSITYLNMIFNNIKITANNIALDITNNTAKDLVLSNESLFIELYSENETLLERIRIYNFLKIDNTSKVSVNFDTKENIENSKYLKIVEVTEEGLPSVDLTKNADDEQQLICNLDNEEITYIFTEEKLIKIKGVYKYSNANNIDEYSNVLMEYKNKSKKINEIVGATSIVTESGLSFIFNSEINVTANNTSSFNNPTYFAKNTSAKRVAFEMESMRYNCQ